MGNITPDIYQIYQKSDRSTESIVLASVMHDALINPQSGMADEMIAGLTRDCFVDPSHARVFTAIVDTRKDGLPADVANVPLHLGDIDRNVFADIAVKATTTSIEAQISKLRALRDSRSALRLMDTAYKAYTEIDNPVEALARMKDAFSEAIVSNDGGSDKGFMLSGFMGEYGRMKKDRANGNKQGIYTGIKAYDDLVGGFHAGELIVIAALQKMGKTNFALSLANYMDTVGQHVAFFTLEMGDEEMGDRIISQRSAVGAEISQRNLKLGKLNGTKQYERLLQVMDDVHKNSQMYINTDGRTTLEDLKSILRRRKADEKLTVAFIDYLQLLVKDEANAREEISNLTRELKLLAKELGIPIVLLSQINNRDAKVGERPHKGQLKGSSSIESDADVVLFPWREGAISNDPMADQSQSTLIIGAIRGVNARDIEMEFSTNTTLFRGLQEVSCRDASSDDAVF